MGITASNLSFGEVNRRFYGRKLRFTAPLTRRRKTKFPTVKPPIYLPKCQIWKQLSPNWSTPRSFLTSSSSVAVLLCASVDSYVAFVLSLLVPHLSFIWHLVRALLRDCGISWVSSFIFSQCTTGILYCESCDSPENRFKHFMQKIWSWYAVNATIGRIWICWSSCCCCWPSLNFKAIIATAADNIYVIFHDFFYYFRWK